MTVLTRPTRDPRDREALRRHYDIERELAGRLMNAAAEERKGLYRTVYNDLFRRVPDHPQNTRKRDPARQEALTRRQLALLKRFLTPDTTYLEIGCGDGHLAMSVARQVRRAYAVDVSDVIAGAEQRPDNLTLVITDGVNIDVPTGSVTVAYSNQLMEHLHPDDAAEQLRQVQRALAAGGTYICVTPHRFSGPHDISSFFGTEPKGFHLKEYTYGELRRLFRAAGFGATAAWVGVKGRFVRVPEFVVLVAEGLLGLLPARLRSRVANWRVLGPLFDNVTVAGLKTGAR